MASEYNSRPPIPEVLVKGVQFAVIRPRPTLEEMINRDTIPSWLTRCMPLRYEKGCVKYQIYPPDLLAAGPYFGLIAERSFRAFWPFSQFCLLALGLRGWFTEP